MNENYLGNPNLKRSNVNINYTKEQLEEYIKCAKDPVYFIEEYIQIVNVDKGLVPFKLYNFQNEMVTAFQKERFVINKLPRQSGKSTTVTAYMLWLILFHDTQSIAILANKGSLARDLLGKIQLAYEHLPKWLQQGIVVWNKGNIELENGSKILASATSSSAIRGGSFNLIFLDEFAFVSNNIAENFFASEELMPSIIEKCWVNSSAPNAPSNMLKEICMDSSSDSAPVIKGSCIVVPGLGLPCILNLSSFVFHVVKSPSITHAS